jgi:hypothetical protein
MRHLPVERILGGRAKIIALEEPHLALLECHFASFFTVIIPPDASDSIQVLPSKLVLSQIHVLVEVCVGHKLLGWLTVLDGVYSTLYVAQESCLLLEEELLHYGFIFVLFQLFSNDGFSE